MTTSLVRAVVDEDGIAHVTLADPAHRNALRYELTQALARAVNDVIGDARTIVFTAEPPVFCSGGSLDELLEPKAPLEELYAGMLALARAPVPTIAAVSGPCIGAGTNLPLACDVIVTSPGARFDPRWLDVGIHPGGANLRRLADRVGRQAAVALVLCGEAVDGADAARLGLSWRCVADEDLLETAMSLARVAARRDRELVMRAKASLDESLAVRGPEDAVRIELEAQRWSMARPGFRERVLQIRHRMQRR